MAKKTKILIVGNGFGGIYTLKNLTKLFPNKKGVEFSMIGERNYFLFTPLLHEVATGGISPLNILEPIRKILKGYLDNFYLGKAENINLKDKIVNINGVLVPFDYLVLSPGAETNFYNIPDAEKYSFTLKSINDAIRIKNHCINQIERASNIKDSDTRKRILKFVVVGGGPTGVELAAELQEFIKDTFSIYYSKEIINDASVVLVQKGTELLPQFSKKIREKSLEVLKRKCINVMLGSAYPHPRIRTLISF
ncbi:FAD-dependent oxidoreductase [Candidatus Nomurabacteria bacterium]|nr:FAD-dependent oxidoreductase [Candidatus Nomurabacteria bacterium]